MMTNVFAAIDIFNLNLGACIAFLGIAALLVVLFLLVRCRVIYIDSEDGSVIHEEKHTWLDKVDIHAANKVGKRLIGWSKVRNGKKPLVKHKVVLFKSIKLYSIWEETPAYTPVAPVPVVPTPYIPVPVDDTEGIFVKFNYVNPQTDDIIDSESFRLNARVPDTAVNGWGFAPDGEAVIKTGKEDYVFAINLYPITALEDSEFESINEPFYGACVVDVSYTLSETDQLTYKESHYLRLKLPNMFNENSKFIGWSVVPDGEPVIERGDIDSVFNILLYSVLDVAQEEEVVEEPVVEEVVVEEPVEEPVVEEPVEEPIVEEEVVEEPTPIYEEIIEEPIPQPAEEEVAQEPVEEPVVEEPVIEEATPILVPTYYDNEGNKIDIKYSRSFTANLIQSEDVVKDYYSELKNHILSYKGVKSRISWKFDSYNRGRDQLFKMKLRGKTICLYCALDPNEFDQSKYHHEAIDAKIFEDVPMLAKIKSGLGLRKAKELVDFVMARFEIEKDEKAKTVDYVAKHPYEPNEPLIARKLIKALVADSEVVVMSTRPKEEPVAEDVVEEVVAEPVVEEAIEEVIAEPVVEETIEEAVAEPVVEEAIEEVVAEPVVEEAIEEVVAEDVVEETIEEVVAEPVVEEAIEEVVAEPVVEEAIEEVVAEPAIEEAIEEIEAEVVEESTEEAVVESSGDEIEFIDEDGDGFIDRISAEDAHRFAQQIHFNAKLETGVDYITAKDTKKAIVNVDVLAKHFNDGDTVTIQAMKDKKVIDRRAKSVKVLARGSLDKKLTILAGEFSSIAIEMITLTGGQAIRVTYEIKK